MLAATIMKSADSVHHSIGITKLQYIYLVSFSIETFYSNSNLSGPNNYIHKILNSEIFTHFPYKPGR
jgi:hypothetical protein